MDLHIFINGKLVSGSGNAPSTPRSLKGMADGLDETPEKLAPQMLKALVASRRFLAISLPVCSQCEELAAALSSRGMPVESVFVKWDKGAAEYPAQKAALAAYAGEVFSFPQVFVDGTYQGGLTEALPKLEAGLYDQVLEEHYSIKPSTVERWVNRQPMIIFSLPQCPQCDQLRSMLESRGLPVEKIFMKWDKAMPQYQSLKAQLVKLIGLTSFTFPQTFVRSEYQGSFVEVAEKVEKGQLDDFFLEAFGVTPPSPTPVEPASIDVGFDDDF